MNSLEQKLAALKAILADMDSLIVAFSGGVDSTFLVKVAFDVLGDRVLAVTATSPTYPLHEFEEAKSLAVRIGCPYKVLESNELEIAGFSENTPRRCYFCKSELFGILKEEARTLGIAEVADGSNCDDLGDYRPGKEAAKELGIRSPLIEAGMTKDDIRELSRALDLPTWDKPSFACLSSRFPYGTSITSSRVEQVGRCEDFLREKGIRQFRVRYHDNVARIEVAPKELESFTREPFRSQLVDVFKKSGFQYVSLDLEGYRSGSMNEVLDEGGK